MASTLDDTRFHDRRIRERRRVAYMALMRNIEGMRVSWGGVFGGVLVAIGLLLLLAALGVAVGISAVDPAVTEPRQLGTRAGIWAAASLLIALFVGGMVATRIGAIFDRSTGFFEGALVWVVSVILTSALAGGGAGLLAGGAFELIGSVNPTVDTLAQLAAIDTTQAARAAWIAFGALLLSLLAAVLGAMVGRRRPQSQAQR
jgi:hypothetical protein